MADLNEKNIESTEEKSASKKKDKNKKPNFFVRMFKGIGRFIRDCISEMKKVTWLSRKETKKSSLVVLAVVIAIGALIGILDTALEFGVLGLFKLTH